MKESPPPKTFSRRTQHLIFLSHSSIANRKLIINLSWESAARLPFSEKLHQIGPVGS